MKSAHLASTMGLLLAACLGDVEVPPEPPTLVGVVSPTSSAEQVLRGGKSKGTGVLLGEELVVPADESETFELTVRLHPGPNHFVLKTQRASGLLSRKITEVDIEYEPLCPAAPTLEALPPVTSARTLVLRGTKPPRTSIELDDTEIVPLDEDSSFEVSLDLGSTDGSIEHDLFARDERGQRSDPVAIRVRRDTIPPAVGSRHPAPDARFAPVNSRIWVVFDDDLSFPTGIPDAALLQVNGPAGPVMGVTTYAAGARSLVFATQSLPADATITVSLDPALAADLAGNLAAGGPSTWTFTTTTGPDGAAPVAPTVEPVAAMIFQREVALMGTKGPGTGVEVNGAVVAAVDLETEWTHDLPVPVGTTSVAIASLSATGARTVIAPFDVVRGLMRPPAPTVTAPPEEVTDPSLVLSGTKAAGTSILLGGRAVVCRGPETTWSFSTSLTPGTNEILLEAEDGEGNRSDPTVLAVRYVRNFDGPVPPGFVLKIDLTLRDLANRAGIREEFETGSNNYGVDIWVEGPLTPGESCRIVDGHRQDIRYVATIEHYVGVKSQHEVPFLDVDYKGTDYLASLITAGVFEFRGLGPGSPRRDASGRELPGLLAGLTPGDIKANFDCLGQIGLGLNGGVDACTQATSKAGPHDVPAWTPRARGSTGVLEQGEYLLYIQLSLDRSGTWLTANDYETCWGEVAYAGRGNHRVVRRIALGADPFTLTVPPNEELSGTDVAGADELFYLDDPGVTIKWGPR